MTPAEAAAHTRLPAAALRRIAEAGAIEVAWTPGGRRRYLAASVREYRAVVIEGRSR
jgi:hypothetical protein